MGADTGKCPGSGMRTLRPWHGPDLCPVCGRKAYVRVDGTTGVHRATAELRRAARNDTPA